MSTPSKQKCKSCIEMQETANRLVSEGIFGVIELAIHRLLYAKRIFKRRTFRRVIWRGIISWLCPEMAVKKEIWKFLDMALKFYAHDQPVAVVFILKLYNEDMEEYTFPIDKQKKNLESHESLVALLLKIPVEDYIYEDAGYQLKLRFSLPLKFPTNGPGFDWRTWDLVDRKVDKTIPEPILTQEVNPLFMAKTFKPGEPKNSILREIRSVRTITPGQEVEVYREVDRNGVPWMLNAQDPYKRYQIEEKILPGPGNCCTVLTFCNVESIPAQVPAPFPADDFNLDEILSISPGGAGEADFQTPEEMEIIAELEAMLKLSPAHAEEGTSNPCTSGNAQVNEVTSNVVDYSYGQLTQEVVLNDQQSQEIEGKVEELDVEIAQVELILETVGNVDYQTSRETLLRKGEILDAKMDESGKGTNDQQMQEVVRKDDNMQNSGNAQVDEGMLDAKEDVYFLQARPELDAENAQIAEVRSDAVKDSESQPPPSDEDEMSASAGAYVVAGSVGAIGVFGQPIQDGVLDEEMLNEENT